MSLICALSNVVANEPVISPVSGSLFERRLICKYLKENHNRDPINNAKLVENQLIPLNDASLSAAPSRPEDDRSVTELVRLLREQLDDMIMERFELNKNVQNLTKQLSASAREKEMLSREKEILSKEKEMISREKEVLTREKEILLSQQNDLCKFIEILKGKLAKSRQSNEEGKRSLTDLAQTRIDNVYSNLPTIENKENIFSSSINSSNGSSFRNEPAIQLDHNRFGHLSGHHSNHHHNQLSSHLSNHCLKSGSTNGHSPNFSSINSKFSEGNVFFNEQHLASLAHSNLPSPKFGPLIGGKFADQLPGSSKFNALPSPKLDNLTNQSKFFDLTNSKSNFSSNTMKSVREEAPKCGSQLPNTNGQSPSSFQKYNKLCYSTEYVNLNGNNRLFDRNHRTQSVIIQNDSLFDSGLGSMRSCEENLNYRNDQNTANNFLTTPSSSGSLKRYGSNGTFNNTVNSDGNLASHCSANYVNTASCSRPLEEASTAIYCNLPAMNGEFDQASLTSRRPRSAMIDYANILMFDDNPQESRFKRGMQSDRSETKNATRIGKEENEDKKDQLEAKENAKEECGEKISNVEKWAKDFKFLLKDPVGKAVFTVSAVALW